MEYSPWLPEDPALSSRQLVLFAVYCYKYGSDSSSVRGNSLQTIQSKISAVAWYHRCEYGVNIGLLPHHAMAIKGIHRLQPSPRPKQPITVSILRILHQQLNFHSAHDRVLWGATVMGFFFLLRRSEYLLHDNKIYQFAIRRSDIKFYDKAGKICEGKAHVQRVEINFRGGKNDQAGVGTSRSLTSSETQWCCPVRAIWFLVEHHRTVSEDPDELLCKVKKNEFLRSNDVNKWIKKAANLAGQDSSRFSTHSLRIGGATALFAGGIDSLTIKLFGRWRSAVFERYTRIQAQVTTAMARCMINPSQAACSNQHQLQGHPPRHTRAGGCVNTTSYVPQN
eukprot:jgi/Phyca11/126023/e_gw1.61.219.1